MRPGVPCSPWRRLRFHGSIRPMDKCPCPTGRYRCAPMWKPKIGTPRCAWWRKKSRGHRRIWMCGHGAPEFLGGRENLQKPKKNTSKSSKSAAQTPTTGWGGQVCRKHHAATVEMGRAYLGRRHCSRQCCDSEERSVLRLGSRLEDRRNAFRAGTGV